jgi:hypothetical protein
MEAQKNDAEQKAHTNFLSHFTLILSVEVSTTLRIHSTRLQQKQNNHTFFWLPASANQGVILNRAATEDDTHMRSHTALVNTH